MNSFKRAIRIILIVLVACAFAYLAYYLYDKQRSNYSHRSFEIEEADYSILITDVDRLTKKLREFPDLEFHKLPSELDSALSMMVARDSFSFKRDVGRAAFISAKGDDFIVAVKNPELDGDYISNLITNTFNVQSSFQDDKITIGSRTFGFSTEGDFCSIRTMDKFEPNKEAEPDPLGNPDYMVFESGTGRVIHHMVSSNYHFELWESDTLAMIGRPVRHESFFHKIPAEFDRIEFFGSHRLEEDAGNLFGEINPENYSWIDQGFLLIRKDSFELFIAPQNDQRDLRLILEENTLKEMSDSAQINRFNIGVHDVMAFRQKENWGKDIPALSDNLAFYSEYENFNVLSNTIPAMRWYLTQIQLGNFFLKDDFLSSTYSATLPEKASHIMIERPEEADQNLVISSQINELKNELNTRVVIKHKGFSGEGLASLLEFIVDIGPTEIQLTSKGSYLLSNKNQVALYGNDGSKKWMVDLSSPLTTSPQLIDFENDGTAEIALFQQNQLDILNGQGKSKPGFPVKLDKNSAGGVALNYDQKYNYRLLISSGNQIRCINEEGKTVMGWMFKGMEGHMQDGLLYKQVQGKDVISFADSKGKQYRLNRRGEARYQNTIRKRIANRAPFTVGNTESKLSIMGYKNQYIYRLYLMDGAVDSVKVDERINPVKLEWKETSDGPMLLVEESQRVLMLDQFGYVKDEVLKGGQSQEIAAVLGTTDFQYLFSDNYQNSLYLRDRAGKLIFPHPIQGSSVLTVSGDKLITYVGSRIKVYKIN